MGSPIAHPHSFDSSIFLLKPIRKIRTPSRRALYHEFIFDWYNWFDKPNTRYNWFYIRITSSHTKAFNKNTAINTAIELNYKYCSTLTYHLKYKMKLILLVAAVLSITIAENKQGGKKPAQPNPLGRASRNLGERTGLVRSPRTGEAPSGRATNNRPR